MHVMVGCPISNRSWIFPAWMEYVEKAAIAAQIDELSFCFAVNANDPKIVDVYDVFEGRPWKRHWTYIYDDEVNAGEDRHWNANRFARMVFLRNQLLNGVKASGFDPDYFLSLDSDILLHHEALWCMLDTIQETGAWAVGSKVYLTKPPQRTAPNYAMMKSGGLRRPDSSGVFKVDVLMAVKLMGWDAIETPYQYHEFGEDIGWSMHVRKRGGTLMWDGRFASKHVMSPRWLSEPDPRLGW